MFYQILPTALAGRRGVEELSTLAVTHLALTAKTLTENTLGTSNVANGKIKDVFQDLKANMLFY